MANIIKNLHLLADIISEADKALMEQAAKAHGMHNNITFKFMAIEDKKVSLRVTQDRNVNGSHFPAKRLIEIGRETFGRFFPGCKIIVHPVTYQEPMVNKVDDKWIRKKMESTGVKLKTIQAETGIDYTYLSSITSGSDPLSQPMKAMFWYYFIAKELQES